MDTSAVIYIFFFIVLLILFVINLVVASNFKSKSKKDAETVEYTSYIGMVVLLFMLISFFVYKKSSTTK